MKRIALLLFFIATASASEVILVKIKGEITEGTFIEIQNAYEVANKENADLLLVEIDTPGGLFSSTQKIVEIFLRSEIPVVAYVDRGSICASAGTIILLSAHITALANGTAIGAATPVGMTPGTENKTINYIATYVKDIANTRGRNAEIAEKFVKEALSLTAREAHELGIVDVLADSREELLKKLNSRIIILNGKEVKIDTKNYRIIEVKKPLRAEIYGFISNPAVAVILLMAGIYLLIFGLTSPGMLAEIVGAVLLLLALAGFGFISVDYLGILLIVLGILFLIAELLTPTYGALSIASIISIILGLVILVKEPLMPLEFYDFFLKFAIGIGVGIAIVMTFMISKIMKIRRKRSEMGEVVRLKGEVLEFKDGKGFARVRGEIWNIESEDDLKRGDEVLVISREGLKLKVRKVENRGSVEIGDKKMD
ncbi:MAG: nodulation protein NfeD [Archaeoglobaceae archaeon]|nr:nodulation protein NfeD [Archaeoglobaceae archaeon]MDW7990148.1 nodulation protein NfeD [Archaeoglobaceae archaeon]